MGEYTLARFEKIKLMGIIDCIIVYFLQGTLSHDHQRLENNSRRISNLE